MKKTIIIPIFILFLLIGSVIAEEVTLEGNTKGADPMELSFWQKVGNLFSTQQTVLGGSKCSIYPDYENKKIYTSSSICWRNEDGGSPASNGREHDGVVFQLFALSKWTHGTWFIIDEVKILAGEIKCLDIPTGGYEYVINAYYCDEEANPCDNIDFQTVCHTDTQTKKVRYCTGNEPEVVWIEGKDPRVPYCDGYPKVQEPNEPEETCTKTCSGNYYLNKEVCKCICSLSPNDCESDEYLKNCECQAEQQPSCDKSCGKDEYLDYEDCKCYPEGKVGNCDDLNCEGNYKLEDCKCICDVTESECNDLGMDFDSSECECINREQEDCPEDYYYEPWTKNCKIIPDCDEGDYFNYYSGLCLPLESCDLTEEECTDANTKFNEEECKCEEKEDNIFTGDDKYLTYGIILLVLLLVIGLSKKQ